METKFFDLLFLIHKPVPANPGVLLVWKVSGQMHSARDRRGARWLSGRHEADGSHKDLFTWKSSVVKM